MEIKEKVIKEYLKRRRKIIETKLYSRSFKGIVCLQSIFKQDKKGIKKYGLQKKEIDDESQGFTSWR